MLHTGVSTWYIALNRMLFSFWAVSATSNFFVADLASKQSTQRAILFLFLCDLSTGGYFFVHDVTARWRLGAYGRCLWPLGAYVIEPPNRSSLIVVLNALQANLRC